jgi:hypothetical protein
MLTQQTVRHLLKALTVKGSSSSNSSSSSSSVKSDSAYLRGWQQGSKCTAQSERDMQQLPLLHAAFRCLITHIYDAYAVTCTDHTIVCANAKSSAAAQTIAHISAKTIHDTTCAYGILLRFATF